LTANTQMLRDNGLMDRFPEITHAMADVVAKGGYATSVTPVSQFYFQQAFNNVMFGPYKKIAEGYGKMVLGYFGRTPVEPDAEIIKISSEQLNMKPTKELAVDINDKDPKKGRPAAIEMLKKENLPTTEENIFIAASCKEKGILYLTGNAKVNGVRLKSDEKKAEAPAPAAAPAKNNTDYTVKVNNSSYAVQLKGDKAIVNGVSYDISVADGITQEAAAPVQSAPATSSEPVEVKAPMPGLILKTNVSVGDKVKANDVLMVMEAMKMENEIFSPVSGTVSQILVKQGDQKQADEVLLVISSDVVVAQAPKAQVAAPSKAAPVQTSNKATEVKAPMPGLVLRIDVKEGDKVEVNSPILIMEAMKMENEIFAPVGGVVKQILVKQGDQLMADDVLAVIE
ncbi:MAG: acetyl-CoA carboxylase biotin carboxyl carrier protein subunit, partial [Spirochaetia bacterium]|nr:acetyl-CoA carboxylase biotin carboxyl carrier protein subunit [Spirochaetia bacterium]